MSRAQEQCADGDPALDDHPPGVSGDVVTADRVRPAAAVPVMPGAGPEVLVQTKLYAPRQRQEWVSRDALVGQLAGTAHRLVLVEAPAGFGKTTLVAQW